MKSFGTGIVKLAFFVALSEVSLAFTASRRWSYSLSQRQRQRQQYRHDGLISTAEGQMYSMTVLKAGGGLFGGDSHSSRSSSSSFHQPANGSSKGNQGRFATGEELKRLRSDLDSLRENLRWAQAMGDEDRVEDLSKAVQNGENRDPDVVYCKALRAIIDAKASYVLPEEEKERRVQKARDEAAVARKYISRFQLEGLWVGNYGDHQQLINVTYSGDTLIATKVTGDATVPRGKVSFTAELSPANSSSLEPLEVSFDDEKTQLMRYPGKGQVAQTNFVNSKFVEGQLVMLDDQFSFVWIPIRHHVQFRRPTPEQTIHLLRDIIAREDELENMREHLARCFDMDMTESLARYYANGGQEEPFRRISLTSELEDKGTLEAEDGSSTHFHGFWQVNKWREYIDRILGEHDKKKQ